jgi:hypothetical protein
LRQNEILNETIKKASDLVQEATKITTDIWLEQVLFSWRWWFSLFLTIIPWILWIKYRPKQSTYRLLFVGFYIVIITSYLDFLGYSYGLW